MQIIIIKRKCDKKLQNITDQVMLKKRLMVNKIVLLLSTIISQKMIQHKIFQTYWKKKKNRIKVSSDTFHSLLLLLILPPLLPLPHFLPLMSQMFHLMLPHHFHLHYFHHYLLLHHLMQQLKMIIYKKIILKRKIIDCIREKKD